MYSEKMRNLEREALFVHWEVLEIFQSWNGSLLSVIYLLRVDSIIALDEKWSLYLLIDWFYHLDICLEYGLKT